MRLDISFKPEFNELCGFSEREIAENFDLGLLNMSELKKWYNGYGFGGKATVYNPFSVANALVNQVIDCYWVRSGTTKLLADFCGSKSMRDFLETLLMSDGRTINFESLFQSEDALSMGQSIASLERLFLQAGYLTISVVLDNSGNCTLIVPNEEIRRYALPALTIAGLAEKSVF